MSEIPRGTGVNALRRLSGSRLPCGLLQSAASGVRTCSTYAYDTASRPRSCACGPPAWNAIMKAWPLVCMTACANSCVRALMRARISRQTIARISAPASRQEGIAARMAGSRTSRSACGYSTPNSMPYGDTSPPTQPSVPGWPRSRRPASRASKAALPSSALRLPCSPYALGCSGCGDQYARVRIVSSAWSRVGRCFSISCWAVSSAAAIADQLLLAPTLRRVGELGRDWAGT